MSSRMHARSDSNIASTPTKSRQAVMDGSMSLATAMRYLQNYVAVLVEARESE
ncbi:MULTISPECIES: hypothetical protein [unclassified Haladaptatus]|uniref:hypothetical protein n=1 Tax=unclassified Haladaptatus TaxID=2622732 RepID=UPI00209C6044|nr:MULTISPECIES: hypothetical protein [unclassified Haladaptatus]MCO8244997.1 hypothetical protein [Haladaptatus sp. AB643]MCO8253139.1 hypothetical protein [Haladaptatus sp. AB618]